MRTFVRRNCQRLLGAFHRAIEAQGVITLEANLGPKQPRWAPTTESDIQTVVDAGLIKESHFIDAKRETGAAPSDRKETAKDLASYAIDGGALLFGVGEDKTTHRMYLDPQPLNGLIEKIDNIATMIVDPPLSVVSVEIPSDKDPTLGYVLAHIPPSPVAPHMVDGRYYARNERTRRVLQDSEVLRFHTRRESVEERAGQLLDAEIGREPVPDLERRLGHIYLVAQPIGAPAGLARRITREDRQATATLVWETEPQFINPKLAEMPPTPRTAGSQSSRSNGAAVSSNGLSAPGRAIRRDPNSNNVDNGTLLEVELRDDGGVRVFVGHGTTEVGETPAQRSQCILDGLAVAYAKRLIDWAVAIGVRTGWRGSWILGVHSDRLQYRTSFAHLNGFGSFTAPAYDEATYREITTASHLEMEQRPNTVARRLAGRLVETLGTFGHYGPDLTDS